MIPCDAGLAQFINSEAMPGTFNKGSLVCCLKFSTSGFVE
jgi:hypothetical protein